MACCLTAPSHYLNQFSHLIDAVASNSSQFHSKCSKYRSLCSEITYLRWEPHPLGPMSLVNIYLVNIMVLDFCLNQLLMPVNRYYAGGKHSITMFKHLLNTEVCDYKIVILENPGHNMMTWWHGNVFRIRCLNTFRPRQNGRHFPDDFSNAFSWMKMYTFWLIFHWILFARVPINNIPALI